MAKDLGSSRKDSRLRKPARQDKKGLVAVVSFEPNRLSDECLASAYELALPIVQEEPTRQRRKRDNKDESLSSTRKKAVI
ncbi:MAG: hypothetical protein K8F91_06220 [Candidatus Obscuribacterales bacterium]|nr:hypothetical protein [Candidatus Obscuribacterales bacterium]